MLVSIKEVDVEKNIDTFVELLNRNRSNRIGRERFEWLYLKNPCGKAKAWVVFDNLSRDAVAFTCVLPRLVKVEREDVMCWNCGDFSVDKKFRSLGVAIKLRRKAKECVDNSEIMALYAHPNDRMKMIHEKVGHPCIGEMQRFAKVLHADRQLKQLIKIPILDNVLCFGANFILGCRDALLSAGNRRYAFEILSNKPYGDEYDQLFDDASKHYCIIGDRGADYLNWRYGQNPLYKTERLTIRKDGRLIGYLIYCIEDHVAVFKDILCLPDDDVLKALLGYWVKLLRQNKMHSISTILMKTNPVVHSFKQIGFKPRPEISSVHAYANQHNEIYEKWIDGSNWYITVGDRDV